MTRMRCRQIRSRAGGRIGRLRSWYHGVPTPSIIHAERTGERHDAHSSKSFPTLDRRILRTPPLSELLRTALLATPHPPK